MYRDNGKENGNYYSILWIYRDKVTDMHSALSQFCSVSAMWLSS